VNKPQNGKARVTSTQRVARHRERRARGVVFVAAIEVYSTDYTVLKHAGYLESDDPAAVTEEQFQTALTDMLDGEARRLGIGAK
jgi:hypothetical protein